MTFTQLDPPADPLRENRIAKIPLDLTRLKWLLDLPAGMTAERIWMEYDPQRLYVLVSSPALPAQPEGCEAPFLDGAWHVRQVVVDGLSWNRFAWSPDHEPLFIVPPSSDEMHFVIDAAKAHRAAGHPAVSAAYLGGVVDALEWAVGIKRDWPVT